MRYLIENGMYTAVAAPGKAICYNGSYCYKLYRKVNDFSECTEVDISEVPTVPDEATAADYAEAGKILLGVSK